MQKIGMALALCLLSGASVAGGKFTTKDGYLVMPDISVDDKTFYDTVTLKLDFSNGTFSYISSKVKPTTLFDKPIEPQFNEEGFTVGSLGCEKTASTKVSCYLLMVNNNEDTQVTLTRSASQTSYDHQSLLFDNLNNTYVAKSIMLSGSESNNSYLEKTLFQGIPVKVRLDFEGISTSANSIATVKPTFTYRSKSNSIVAFSPTFKNIKF